MTVPGPAAILVGASLLGVVAVVCPRAAAAQSETAALVHGTDTLHLVIHLDSVVVAPRPGVSLQQLGAALASQGFDPVRTLDGGSVVASRFPGFQSADAAIRAGGTLRATLTVVASAGPLARPRSGGLPLGLTDRIIVQLDPFATASERDAFAAAYEIDRVAVSPIDPALVLYRMRPGAADPYFELLRRMREDPRARWAFPDYTEGIREAAADPLLADQWHLHNGAAPGTGDIGATLAWAITAGSSDVVIAVLEVHGFEPAHADLAANLWVNGPEGSGTSGVDDDGNGYVDDRHGWNFAACSTAGCAGSPDLVTSSVQHGTAVAGLIGAVRDNGIGGAGVCPGCRLMLLTLNGTPVAGPAWARIHAFRYARDNGAWVVNASWEMIWDPMLASEIVDLATNGRGGKGVPVFMAAGNSGADFCATEEWLASTSAALAVGASNRTDQRLDSSNWGSCLDLVAPGGELSVMKRIVTTDFSGAGRYNPGLSAPEPDCDPDYSDSGYTRCFGGTSAAAPMAAGVAGLLLSRNPDLTTADVYQALRETAKKVSCADAQYGGSSACPSIWSSHSPLYGYGRLDAFAAVTSIPAAEPPTLEPKAAGRLEVGARLGFTRLAGATSDDVWNGPGGGPDARPVFHVTRAFGGSPSGPGTFLLEVQGGGHAESTGAPPVDRSALTLALQGAWVPTPPLYVGANTAWLRVDDGTVVDTDQALGAALGARIIVGGYLALRLEARYRHWTGRKLDEWGIAAGFGVLLP